MKVLISFLKRIIKKLVFNALNLTNLWKVIIALRGKSQILMYHRISENDDIPGISSKAFESHIKFLTKYYNIVPVSELINDREFKKANKRKIAITFDDGYQDFYFKAWPIIKRYNIPVSLYVSTGFLDKSMWFWPDKIRVLLKETRLTQTDIEGLGTIYIEASKTQENWSDIADLCLRMKPDERERFLTQLSLQLKVEIKKTPSPEYSSVTWEQLQEMHTEGLNVGSHTVSHPLLTCVNKKQLVDELNISKKVLEDRLHTRIEGVCYPNGTKRDVSNAVIEEVKIAKYEYGLVAYCSDNEVFNKFKSQRVPTSERLSELAFNILH